MNDAPTSSFSAASPASEKEANDFALRVRKMNEKHDAASLTPSALVDEYIASLKTPSSQAKESNAENEALFLRNTRMIAQKPENISRLQIQEADEVIGAVNNGFKVPYEIKNGDTLYDLTKGNKSEIAEITEHNGLANPDKIRAGKPLIVPEDVALQGAINHAREDGIFPSKSTLDALRKEGLTGLPPGQPIYEVRKLGENTFADNSGNVLTDKTLACRVPKDESHPVGMKGAQPTEEELNFFRGNIMAAPKGDGKGPIVMACNELELGDFPSPQKPECSTPGKDGKCKVR